MCYPNNTIIFILGDRKMKKLVFTLAKADNKTRIVGIVAIALAVIAIVILATSASKAINGPVTEIAIIKTILPEQLEDAAKDKVEVSLADIKDKLENPDEDLGELEEMLDEAGIRFNGNDALEKAAKAFSIIIGVIKWYAIILAAFVFFSILGMNKGFFITSVSISAIFFVLFAGIVWFFVFLALCIAYCILVSKVKKAYIIYKHEQSKVAEAPVVEEV